MVKKRFLANRFRVLGVLVPLAAVALSATPAFAAASKTSARNPTMAVATAKTVKFSAKFTGKASLLIDNSAVTISSISGTGQNSLFGKSAVSGNGKAPKSGSSLCDPFGGKGTIASGANKITFVVTQSSSQQGCSSGESGKVTITFHGVTKATGGTGKASGAVGSLKFSGTLHLGGTSGSQSGSFTVSLSGNLAVKS
jgi:hypothetical protein